jgi:hypothetical protein
LAVNVTTHGDGAADRLNVGLLQQEFLAHFAQLLKLGLSEDLSLLDLSKPPVTFLAHLRKGAVSAKAFNLEAAEKRKTTNLAKHMRLAR